MSTLEVVGSIVLGALCVVEVAVILVVVLCPIKVTWVAHRDGRRCDCYRRNS